MEQPVQPQPPAENIVINTKLNLIDHIEDILGIKDNPFFKQNEFADIYNKYIGDDAQAQAIAQDINRIDEIKLKGDKSLKEADIQLYRAIRNIKTEYDVKADDELDKSLNNLMKQIAALQIRIILMRCSESIDVSKGMARDLFKDLSDKLNQKLTLLNQIYEKKVDIYGERMKGPMLGGGSNAYKKYMKYKNKYLELKNRNFD